MKNHLKITVMLVMLASIVLSLSAAELKYRVDRPSKLYVGTPFHLLVDITSDPSDSIFTVRPDTLDIFILKDLTNSEEKLEGELVSHFDYTFQPFHTGEYTFPELEFNVKSPNGFATLKTDEFQMIVESVLADSSSIVRDIAAPIMIKPGVWDYLLPLLLLALLIAGTIYLVKLLKRKPQDEAEIPELVDDRPPYQIALELLRQMKQREYLKTGDFLSYYFRLSYILRFFVERQFKFQAVEMTTSEIREKLVTDDFKEKSEIMKFLQFADMVKFAKFIPKLEESRSTEKWMEEYFKSYKDRVALEAATEAKTEVDKDNMEDSDA